MVSGDPVLSLNSWIVHPSHVVHADVCHQSNMSNHVSVRPEPGLIPEEQLRLFNLPRCG